MTAGHRAERSGGPRRALLAVVSVVVLVLALAPQASAVDPQTAVGGSGSKWFSGSLLQQPGQNCSIIGGSYTETMVSAIAGFGGAAGGGLVKVGDRYYAEVLISIPGNPCGPGSTFVGTDLVLPRGTSVDTSAPIRCFGQPRNSNTFGEITGGDWSFTFPNGNTATGKYCPATVGSSLTGTPGAVGVGFRPLASGQLYELFVPIKSTQELQGIGASPADEITWVLSSSGTYSNTGATSVWTTVVPGGSGNTPFIYFARDPSVVPFWLETPPAGEPKNRAEWFANLYSAGIPGNLCWQLHDGPPPASDPMPINCTAVAGWNSTVTAASDTWQVEGGGPNGGYVPFGYQFPSFTYTIRWTFTYNQGGTHTVSKDIGFTTLAGPDSDGDGVPDATDACPAVPGPHGQGCQPAVQVDPDADGVFGSADNCPNADGAGAPDGCPPAKVDTPAPPAPPSPGAPTVPGVPGGNPPTPALVLTGSLGTIKGNKLSRAALAKGAPIPITCGLDSQATATLTVTSAVAKKLKIANKRKLKAVPIGSAAGPCSATKAAKLKLKLLSAVASKVRKPRKGFAATLTVALTRAGSSPLTIKPRALKLT